MAATDFPIQISPSAGGGPLKVIHAEFRVRGFSWDCHGIAYAELDCMEGWVTGIYSVAIRWMSMCTAHRTAENSQANRGGEIMKALTSRFQGVMFNYCTIAIEFPPLTIQSSTMKLRQQDLAQKNKQRLLFHKLFAPLHFKSHQSNMKRINHFHTLFLKNRSFLRWLTPAERQKLANYLCVMAASKLQDQLFLLCCNCRGLSSCV